MAHLQPSVCANESINHPRARHQQGTRADHGGSAARKATTATAAATTATTAAAWVGSKADEGRPHGGTARSFGVKMACASGKRQLSVGHMNVPSATATAIERVLTPTILHLELTRIPSACCLHRAQKHGIWASLSCRRLTPEKHKATIDSLAVPRAGICLPVQQRRKSAHVAP